MTRLLLAGATGLVGGEVLRLALADERITRTVAPTRRPLPQHDKLMNPIVEAGNFTPDADWLAVDTGICAIGTTRAKTPSRADYRAIDLDYPLAIAAAIRERGATRFALTSSMGADPASRFFYTRTKGELEEELRVLDFPSLTIVRPGFIGGDRPEHRSLEGLMGGLLRLAEPLLPAIARISPADLIASILLNAVCEELLGVHLVEAAQIARMASDDRIERGRGRELRRP